MKNKHSNLHLMEVINVCITGIFYLILQLASGHSTAANILGNSPETSTPVHTSQGTAPLVLLTVARDHSLFFPAYNDMSDLNNDGGLEIKFIPNFTYLGLFNPLYCYIYNSTGQPKDQYFQPYSRSNLLTDAVPYGCDNSSTMTLWSGNWLNYVTTSRMDAMRIALYGGYRNVDTSANTILQRAYIPQDGHAWAKEYSSSAENGYIITNYAPFTSPSANLHHFFGNLTSTVDKTKHNQSLSTYIDGNGNTQQMTVPVQGFASSSTLADDVGQSCASLDNCSNFPPLLRVITNSGTRVWYWASSQRPVLDYHPYPIDYVTPIVPHPVNGVYPKGNVIGFGNIGSDIYSYTATNPILTDYTVRVQVCTVLFNDGCKPYVSSGGDITYKPTGVLQDYGDNDSIRFALMTGSYDKNLSGGRIRKNFGAFKDVEVSSTDGHFLLPTYSIINQLNNIRIRNFNNPTDASQNAQKTAFTIPNYSVRYFGNNFIYKNTWSYNEDFIGASGYITGHVMNDNDYGDWGNPIAEMIFEGLRYYAGGPDVTTGSDNGGAASKLSTSAFSTTTTEDVAVGLLSPNWEDPYSDSSTWCAKPNILVISGPNPSFDSDQLPGSPFNPSFNVNLKNVHGDLLNASALTSHIGLVEGINGTDRFVGEKWDSSLNSPLVADRNPTIKTGVNLEAIRGLVPDQTDNQGSFLSAGVAYFGKKYPLRTVNGKNISTVDTYAMLLNNPFPGIKIPFPSQTGKPSITFTPFAKTQVHQRKSLTEQKSTVYMPTNQLVGLYITDVTDAKNTYGTFAATLYAIFEDHAWGGDFEMDFIVQYQLSATADTLGIATTPLSQSGSALQNAGYVISGSTQDGPYIEVQSLDPTQSNPPALPSPYYLNTPANQLPGYCDTNFNLPDCGTLPVSTSTPFRAFTVNPVQNSNNLQNPLWYAARWGGFKDGYEPLTALPMGSIPDHYVQVFSPSSLKVAFQNMIQSILDNSATVGSVTSTTQQAQASSKIFSATYNYNTGYGELTASTYTVTPGPIADSISYSQAWSANSQIANMGWNNRNIVYQAKDQSGLMPFNWSNVGTSNTVGWATQNLFGAVAGYAWNVVDFLRGDRSNEISNLGLLRNRKSVLGTIINSSPVYSQDTGDVYVGANDGMLHAFDSDTGLEKFAYVPTAMITTTNTDGTSILNSLSQPTFNGRYYVDGDIAISEMAKKDPSMTNGRDYLIAFLGRGGKGMFGLKVDASTGAPIDSWEYFPSASLIDNDMGYLLGTPIIERILDKNTNRPVSVAIFGNGYDSNSKQAALYVVRLVDGVVIAKYLTCTGGGGTSNCGTSYDTSYPNGLGTPGVIRDQDYATYVYAGDYRGNVWKFKLPDSVPANPPLVIKYPGSINPNIGLLFTTPTYSGAPQPIVAPITTAYSYDSSDNDVRNKQFIFFGTGSDLTVTDLNSAQIQSLYGLIEPSAWVTTPAISTGNLKGRYLIQSLGTYNGYKSGQPLYVRTINPYTAGDMSGFSGWSMDWFYTGHGIISGASEKVFTASAVRSGVVPTLIVSSTIASSGSCVSDGAGYLNAFDAYHGGGLSSSYFDINRNGSFADETSGGLAITSIDFGIGAIGQAGFTGNNVIVQGSGANPSAVTNNFGDVGTRSSSAVSRRISWREITN